MKHNSDISLFLYRVYLNSWPNFFASEQREKFMQTYVQKWVDFILIEKFKKYFNYLIFYFSWHNTLIAHEPNLIYVEFLLFVKSQFTKSTQNFLHLNQRTHGHSWSRNVAPFQRSVGGCEWLDRHQQCIGEVPLTFQCLSSQTKM
jgi:hypothetical protein